MKNIGLGISKINLQPKMSRHLMYLGLKMQCTFYNKNFIDKKTRFTYETGMKNLVFATTRFNLNSSRSHSMFIINVEARKIDDDAHLFTSKLTLVPKIFYKPCKMNRLIWLDLKKAMYNWIINQETRRRNRKV